MELTKSEYYEPKRLPGEKDCPSIILDAERLYALLLRAELMMTKVDRQRYASRAIGQILDVIREFTLAYDFEGDRLLHLQRMCADIAVFIRTMRIIGERNIICIQPKYENATPEQMKLMIVESLARLDEGATRWRKSILKNNRNKGTTRTDG